MTTTEEAIRTAMRARACIRLEYSEDTTSACVLEPYTLFCDLSKPLERIPSVELYASV